MLCMRTEEEDREKRQKERESFGQTRGGKGEESSSSSSFIVFVLFLDGDGGDNVSYGHIPPRSSFCFSHLLSAHTFFIRQRR